MPLRFFGWVAVVLMISAVIACDHTDQTDESGRDGPAVPGRSNLPDVATGPFDIPWDDVNTAGDSISNVKAKAVRLIAAECGGCVQVVQEVDEEGVADRCTYSHSNPRHQNGRVRLTPGGKFTLYTGPEPCTTESPETQVPTGTGKPTTTTKAPTKTVPTGPTNVRPTG